MNNGRTTSSQEFGFETLQVNNAYYIIPSLDFKLPTNAQMQNGSQGDLVIKFKKWKVCDEAGNLKEAWFLSTEPFDLAP